MSAHLVLGLVLVADGSLGRNVGVARFVDENLLLAGGHADGVALAASRRGRRRGKRRNCGISRGGVEGNLYRDAHDGQGVSGYEL